MQNLVGQGTRGKNRSVSRTRPALGGWGNWGRGLIPTSGQLSEGVFLMYPWREMDSMSTYSSAILFSWLELFCFLTQCFMRYWWEIWPQTCTSKLFPSRIWLYFGMQSDVLKLQCVERELINTLQKLPVTLSNLPVISQALSHIPFQRKYQEWFALL